MALSLHYWNWSYCIYLKFLLTFIINWLGEASETLGLTNWQLPVRRGKKYFPSGRGLWTIDMTQLTLMISKLRQDLCLSEQMSWSAQPPPRVWSRSPGGRCGPGSPSSAGTSPQWAWSPPPSSAVWARASQTVWAHLSSPCPDVPHSTHSQSPVCHI